MWSGYNPQEYLKRLVNFEEQFKPELYDRRLIPDTDRLTKKIWKVRIKSLIASISL